MPETRDKSGEAFERRQRRGWYKALGASIVAGLATGLGYSLAVKDDFFGGRLPPWFAIGVAALYLAMMVAGTVAVRRTTDELERHNNLWGLGMGASAVMLIYPPWWMLWRGGLVGEPSHTALFLLLVAISTFFYLWKKYR
jgi:hypothetical protein